MCSPGSTRMRMFTPTCQGLRLQISGDLESKAGRFRWGYGLKVGYYAQHVFARLDPDADVYSHLSGVAAPDLRGSRVQSRKIPLGIRFESRLLRSACVRPARPGCGCLLPLVRGCGSRSPGISSPKPEDSAGDTV